MDILSALRSVTISIRDWVNEKLKDKVDTVEGKGLSTNDLTDELVGRINANEKTIADIDNNMIKTVNGVKPDQDGNVELQIVSEQVQSDWEQNDRPLCQYAGALRRCQEVSAVRCHRASMEKCTLLRRIGSLSS